jgi:hypothetical protein
MAPFMKIKLFWTSVYVFRDDLMSWGDMITHDQPYYNNSHFLLPDDAVYHPGNLDARTLSNKDSGR